ncbi:hypothetical protein Mx8p58 [Myxococcus phage Mx8]|uniref:p58 n=1 Tax=Myxococcus phage Mx8 TaxID=49964 RepID=Q94MR1_9CAUD|nr:hypothetical protein Mx8p58 [Myxococcus phage Mx8]AAK94393.1 p58 [Myxococcus phage Mx8]
MRILLALLAAVALFACGGPDFEGRWRGHLTQVVTCPGGTANRTLIMDLVAKRDGDDVNFAGNTSCGVISTRVNGDAVSIRSVTCLPITSDGASFTDSIRGGTMTLKGDILEVDARMTTRIESSSDVVDCQGPLTGTLARED